MNLEETVVLNVCEMTPRAKNLVDRKMFVVKVNNEEIFQRGNDKN